MPDDNAKKPEQSGAKKENPKTPPDLEDLAKKLLQKLRGKTKKAPLKNASSPTENPQNIPQKPKKRLSLLWLFPLALLIWVFAGILFVPAKNQVVILRFGNYHATLSAGTYWIPRFIDKPLRVDVQDSETLAYPTELLTKDENLVAITAKITYRITNPQEFLFGSTSALQTLKLATAAALSQVIGNSAWDDLFKKDTLEKIALNTQLAEKLTAELKKNPIGITILSASLSRATPPQALSEAVTKVIAANEQGKNLTDAASAYQQQKLTQSETKAQSLLATARAYQKQVVLKAESDTNEYLTLLAAYKKAPEATRTQLYLATLNNILRNNKVVLLDTKGESAVHLTLDKSVFNKGQPLPEPVTLAKKQTKGAAGKAQPKATDNMPQKSSVRPATRPSYTQRKQDLRN